MRRKSLPTLYPYHLEAWKIYLGLGSGRTLKRTAEIYFEQAHPQKEITFDSFYVKIKRWARKENWMEWVTKKEMQELERIRCPKAKGNDIDDV